ncbi:NAD-dependent epimerase/dehydratase family protein [Winogradskyella echinorum]|uniref:NAD-dependent epimerase/dehydratase family protein n=1 Tax=Winogradskyella echinorum TaxID=538189 RepID=A0ABR6Y2H9_9FLAO|nr:NAD-dependent epimerase/dehydratase family protein [Winogradskyella echinorum]MBC3846954.1 NAD-dependent epimerase/dehydratase family protein [Winogradskyella echinorum]MBC5751302.1 NAD-dependent epimerase/dehydratase family protein [Winogradskyella echinorum]
MINVLVTGGAGQLGSSIASKLALKDNVIVVIVDNLSTGDISKVSVKDNIKFIKADVNNYNDIISIFATFKFHYVFHFAAVVGVERTLENPINVLNDIDGIKNILSLSKNSGVKRVFYSSSSEVYGEPFEIPQNENTTPLNSRLPYAIVKNVGEAFFRAYQREYDLNYTIFRFFNTYGPLQSNDFVIPRFMKLAMKNQPIPIYGEGDQTRSFCYIEDNVDTCLNALYNEAYINDVLNVGNDNEISILELAKKVIEITDSKSEIVFLPSLKEGDMLRRCPDITKMKTLLGRDLISLEEGLNNMMNFYNTYTLQKG